MKKLMIFVGLFSSLTAIGTEPPPGPWGRLTVRRELKLAGAAVAIAASQCAIRRGFVSLRGQGTGLGPATGWAIVSLVCDGLACYLLNESAKAYGLPYQWSKAFLCFNVLKLHNNFW